MTKEFGADPALVPAASSQQVVSTKGFDPGEGETLTISGFLATMAARFVERAALSEEGAIISAVNSLEAWETVFKEPVELTEECAHDIVDTELEHWEAD